MLVNLQPNPLETRETVPGSTLIPLTSGLLYTSTCWGVDREGHSLAPPVKTEHTHSVSRYFRIFLNDARRR